MGQSKQYKVEISEKGRRGLAKIVAYYAIENIELARKVKQEIIASIKTLELFPERCPFFEGEFIPYNKYHKLVLHRHFIALYIVQDETVRIEYIIDCRQDYQWLIR